jgi:hypothetical protein
MIIPHNQIENEVLTAALERKPGLESVLLKLA